MDELCDVLVIGGGPAGAAAAVLLARAGRDVVVLERKTFPRRKVCGEYLSGTNLPLFRHLGVAEAFGERAGPDVTSVGLFAGETVLSADLPRPPGGWGRALSREVLDGLLLDKARSAGARVLQPWSAKSLSADESGIVCQAEALGTAGEVSIRARAAVAAHGSWEAGPLPTQAPRLPPRGSDMLGFKAHFRGARLGEGLMPLLSFPGGFGGMVWCEEGLASLSCCVRRDRLEALRAAHSSASAGEALFASLLESCRGVRESLDGAEAVGAWLGAGPIRPGLRAAYHGSGVFAAGNAAGEAYPAVAEGISMALQSGWLLARRLDAALGGKQSMAAAGAAYSADWRRAFAPRVRAAAAIAHWAAHPLAVRGSLPLLRHFPALLSWGARLSGKSTRVVA